MITKEIALTIGDGSAPDQMANACLIVGDAAKKDEIQIVWVQTQMGWCVYKERGDTLPKESLETATKIGLLFFGGVGEKALDKTWGKENPKMKPEGRCLLTIRDQWGLLINERPAIYHPWLRGISHVAGIQSGRTPIPEGGIQQIWLRYLLEDGYFGNRNLSGELNDEVIQKLGIKQKDDVVGNESMITNMSYFTDRKVWEYFYYAFTRARKMGLPLICVDKSNVMPHHVFWRKIAEIVHEKEFPDVEMKVLFSDAAVQALFHPELLHGVIACTNVDGDYLSDGALEAVGSMGLMHSSAINPTTGAAMFESGAGTYPEAKGKDIANPIGRILTGALMLRHIGAVKGAIAIEQAVRETLKAGYRTPDLVSGASGEIPVGTDVMAEQIYNRL